MRVAALFGESFEPGNISLGDLGIDFERTATSH
jgi:hypothetical protein